MFWLLTFTSPYSLLLYLVRKAYTSALLPVSELALNLDDQDDA